MAVSGQRHAPAALYPRGQDRRYPLDRGLSGPQSRSGHRGMRKKKAAMVYFNEMTQHSTGVQR
jgi:hypothetical protein